MSTELDKLREDLAESQEERARLRVERDEALQGLQELQNAQDRLRLSGLTHAQALFMLQEVTRERDDAIRERDDAIRERDAAVSEREEWRWVADLSRREIDSLRTDRGVTFLEQDRDLLLAENARLRNVIISRNEADTRDLTPREAAIVSECRALADLLIRKNRAYGDSAADPLRVFSRADPLAAIHVRMDDKLSRIARGRDHDATDESLEDTKLDLAGYLILERVLRAQARDAEPRVVRGVFDKAAPPSPPPPGLEALAAREALVSHEHIFTDSEDPSP